MKILQLGKFYPIRGGVEKVMESLTEGISARGICCDMLCASFDGQKALQVIPLNEYGRIFVVPTWKQAAGTMLAPRMISWLRAHAGDYDLIDIHHPDPMAALALRLSGFRGPVVLHWHSDIVSQRVLLAFYQPLQRWLIRRADRIVGTTPVYVHQSPALARVQDKCTAVPIGINPIVCDPERAAAIRSRHEGKTLLLSIGRLVPYKGYSYLIAAMKHLPNDCHLLLVGEGPLRVELEAQIASEGLQDRITLAGRLSDEDVAACFGACDLFVLSSRLKTEAFGIVQIEAMSCGKPVVATRIPGSGVAWVNADGVSGRNAAPEDAEDLARAIREVLRDKDRYSEGAKQRYVQCFRREEMIQKTITVYDSIKND